MYQMIAESLNSPEPLQINSGLAPLRDALLGVFSLRMQGGTIEYIHQDPSKRTFGKFRQEIGLRVIRTLSDVQSTRNNLRGNGLGLTVNTCVTGAVILPGVHGLLESLNTSIPAIIEQEGDPCQYAIQNHMANVCHNGAEATLPEACGYHVTVGPTKIEGRPAVAVVTNGVPVSTECSQVQPPVLNTPTQASESGTQPNPDANTGDWNNYCTTEGPYRLAEKPYFVKVDVPSLTEQGPGFQIPEGFYPVRNGEGIDPNFETEEQILERERIMLEDLNTALVRSMNAPIFQITKDGLRRLTGTDFPLNFRAGHTLLVNTEVLSDIVTFLECENSDIVYLIRNESYLPKAPETPRPSLRSTGRNIWEGITSFFEFLRNIPWGQTVDEVEEVELGEPSQDSLYVFFQERINSAPNRKAKDVWEKRAKKYGVNI